MIAAHPHTRCRACDTTLPQAFLDLGMQPLANNLCRGDEHCDDVFPMRLCRCAKCGLLQLDTVIDPAAMFSHYLYTPSQSKKTLAHFEELADTATKRMRGSLIRRAVDIGSNDGALLGMLKQRGWSVCGVDPAENLVHAANTAGLSTIVGFFNDTTVDEILAKHGRADLITANNVFAHTPDWDTFARCVWRLLHSNGLLAIEFPYGPTMLKDGTFDLIYFEHASYPSLNPIDYLFARYGMSIQDVEDLPDVHGGSVRVWIGFERKATAAVRDKILAEWETGSAEACARFADHVENAARELRYAILMAGGGICRVIGYTAPAKCVTLLIKAQLIATDIDFIIDDNPLKQGRLLPELHIPIRSLAEASLRAGDTVIIFAWNVAEDIIARLPLGVDVIIPMPGIKVVRR